MLFYCYNYNIIVKNHLIFEADDVAVDNITCRAIARTTLSNLKIWHRLIINLQPAWNFII
jgi:hypothetical protein